MTVRGTIKGNRRLFTYLDKAFRAVERIEQVPYYLYCAIDEMERAGHDTAAMRALQDQIEGLRLADALESAVCAVDAPAVRRRVMGFLPPE